MFDPRLRLVFFSFVLTGLAACQSSVNKGVPLLQTKVSQESIIGGAPMLPADDLSHSEVFIRETTDHSKASCTGVFVSALVVLTDAHCVLNSQVNPNNLQVFFYSPDERAPELSLIHI